MRKLVLAVAAVFLIAVSLYLPREASAVPAFARQVGMACNACHFQHFPILNQFGRAFKAGGYSMTGGNQGLIEGDFLSIPSVLNASVITKIKFVKTNGGDDTSGTNKGKYEMPEEAALYLAGRIGEHIGFALEGQMTNGSEAMAASFKMPIGVYQHNDINFEVIPFTTENAGPAFGFEVLATGAYGHGRVLEHGMDISSQLYVGTNKKAVGLSFVANNPKWFANYTVWSNAERNTDANPYLHYVRVAVTPQYNGWDLGGGFQWWGGEEGGTDGAGTDVRQKAEAFAVDFQAHGAAGDYPLGVYLTYAAADKSDATGAQNLFNISQNDDRTAWSILAELGVIPNRATLAIAYRDGDTGEAADNEQTAITFGGTYLLAQNFELQINHSIYGGNFYDTNPANGDVKTTLMIFAAF
jgi:hypothetical protein